MKHTAEFDRINADEVIVVIKLLHSRSLASDGWWDVFSDIYHRINLDALEWKQEPNDLKLSEIGPQAVDSLSIIKECECSADMSWEMKRTLTMTNILFDRGISKEMVMEALGYKRTLSAFDLSISGKSFTISALRCNAWDALLFDMIE